MILNEQLEATPEDEAATTPVLRGIKNERDKETRIVEPWLFRPSVPAELIGNKTEYRKWRNKEDTNHLLYSASVGGHATSARVSKDNPVQMICGLIADYDVPAAPALVDTRLANWNGAHLPNWVHRTFSGGMRLVWLFEKFVALDDKEFQQKFLQIARQKLSVDSHFAGLDESAWNNLTKYFDVGTGWQQVSESPIQSSHVESWMMEANAKMRWKSDDTLIPLEDVAAEIEQRYPGQMHLDKRNFEEGARCNVFWEGRQNPTAAIIQERGIVAFSSHRLFHTWRDILGGKFVDKFASDKVGRAAEGKYFDGQRYWIKTGDGWMQRYKEDLVMHLRKHRLDASKKSDNTSEVENVLLYIQDRHSVAGAVPCLFDQRDVVKINGKQFLNSSCVRPIQPAVGPQHWATNFSWIARFLELRFSEVERQYFLAWWKRFYGSALQGCLLKGHSLFIVGDTDTGKTLLSDRLVGASVGGHVDASTYITKDSEFNKELMEVGLWTINDGEVASDARSHARFSERVKAAVANPTMNYRAMYRDSQMITWNGRLLVTLNGDSHSLQMLPDLAVSMEEKVMVLRFSDTPYSFPPRHEVEGTIAAELPYFLRWLVEWHVPIEIAGGNRLGVKSYIDENLRLKALSVGQAGNLFEIIELWIKRTAFVFEDKDGNKLEYWEGSASEFYALVMSDETLRPLVAKFTPRGIGMRFAGAALIRDSGIELAHSSSKGNRYRIWLKR